MEKLYEAMWDVDWGICGLDGKERRRLFQGGKEEGEGASGSTI